MSDLTTALRSLETDQGYLEFEKQIRDYFQAQTGPFFRTTATDALWQAYIDHLPANQQHYNCRCCHNFLTRFGGLVTLDGEMLPAILPPLVHSFFQASVTRMREIIQDSQILGVFVNSDAVLGVERSPKGWTHLHTKNHYPWTDPLKTAAQREAELLEESRLLDRTLVEFTVPQVETALRVLESEQFPGYQKGVDIAKWFHILRQSIAANRRRREALIWSAVASAPPGYAHLRNGMVGTLFNDIAEGKTFEQCRRSWSDKMNPVKYRRPTAPPKTGVIDQAERIVEKLGIAASLERRFATLDDIKTIFWAPRGQKPTEGVFGLLRRESRPTGMLIPNQRMTWAKFSRDVLPDTDEIEINCPAHGGYTAFVTATNPEAPPIIQWDFPERREPVSYYTYVNGSPAVYWRVASGWNRVVAMFRQPHPVEMRHFKPFVTFVIQGAHDTRRAGLALFPEILKSELHTVRSVIEAHSQRGQITGEGSANGLCFDEGHAVHIRVNKNAEYTIDRWE